MEPFKVNLIHAQVCLFSSHVAAWGDDVPILLSGLPLISTQAVLQGWRKVHTDAHGSQFRFTTTNCKRTNIGSAFLLQYLLLLSWMYISSFFFLLNH